MNNQAIEYLETALQNSNPTALDNDTVRFLRINIEKALQALQPAPVKQEQDGGDVDLESLKRDILSREYVGLCECDHDLVLCIISDINERGLLRTTPEDGKGVILGYLHEVIEPDGQYHKMYSAQEESPWKHWKEDHQAGCRYKRTALFGATQQPEHEVK